MLARAGIAVQVRLVDAVQYEERLSSFDFDMIEYRWDQSLSPGNEQSFYLGLGGGRSGRLAQLHGRQKRRGRRHDRGAAAARDRPDFVAAVRALDRVLMSG